MVYYNEFDPKAAAWLRELIKAGLIPAGDVDERSIVDVNPYELTQYTQHHFFAGIGGWAYALRLAGWPDDKPVVTGSCPCQPFSAAGKQLGTKDERHLWPVFRNILTFLGAPIAFGEQVASAAGREWLVGVRTDLEALGYEVGAADLCAAGASPEVEGWIWIPDEIEPEGGSWIPINSGPPHMRQRLFWVAHASGARRRALLRPSKANRRKKIESDGHRDVSAMADTDGGHPGAERQQRGGKHGQQPEDRCAGGLGNTDNERLEERRCERGDDTAQRAPAERASCEPDRLEHAQGDRWLERWTESERRRTGRGCWDVYSVVNCTDGKARRFEPGSFPLAHGLPGRVGLLRGYGNAIIPQLAAEFIQAATESI